MVKRVLRDIPESKVAQMVEDFESEGCTVTKKEKQSNGKWKVEAECPDTYRRAKKKRMAKKPGTGSFGIKKGLGGGGPGLKIPKAGPGGGKLGVKRKP